MGREDKLLWYGVGCAAVIGLFALVNESMAPYSPRPSLPPVTYTSQAPASSLCMDEFAQQVRTEMYGRASSQAFCDSMQRLRSAPR